MPNQNPNGRNMNRDRDEQRPSWRQQDMMDDDRERMSRGGNESRWGARREWDDDRDDRYRDDRSTDRYGGGQSGYGSGRFGDDRSMGPGYRNQSSYNRMYDDRQGMHTDDRFTGRGGPQYWDDRSERGYPQRSFGYDDRFERGGYNSGYHQGTMGFGGYGHQGNQQNIGSQQGFRGAGNAGAQFADDYNRGRQLRGRDFDRGMGYGQGHGFGLGQGMGHRGKGPQGYTRSDDRIKEQVCEMLSDDDNIDASHVEVVVKNGEVILTGTVEDRRTKRLAEDLVERASGVKDVQNQLRVSERRGNQNMGSAVGRNETETSSTDKKHRA